MPTMVSILMRRRWWRTSAAVCGSVAPSRMSSISCAACQKNRYGLIVVPNTATIVSSISCPSGHAGTTAERATCNQSSRSVKATPT